MSVLRFHAAMFLSSLAACAHAMPESSSFSADLIAPQDSTCAISDSEREALLASDYRSFDQSLPNGGWRKYDKCHSLIRELIDAYVVRHQNTLEKWQKNVLVWHSGQISAMANETSDAIAKMNQTLKPDEKPTDAFLWNPYVKATVAFLLKNRVSLIQERSALARGDSPYNRLNLRIVDSFIRCFDSSYEKAYSSNCTPPETNVDRIRSLASPLDLNKPANDDPFSLANFFKGKKIILIGEVHGTNNVPELFGDMVSAVVDNNSKTLVALELPQSAQANIDVFLKTGNDDVLRNEPFFAQGLRDGRSSQAMVALLRRLSKMPNTKVLCIDVDHPASSSQERDTGMAVAINANRVGFDRTLVLTGNIHSRTSVGTPWDENFRPMGYELKTLAKDLGTNDLLNILVRYGKLDSWHCEAGSGQQECKIWRGKHLSTDYSNAVGYEQYFLLENPNVDSHNATIFLRSATPSLPFLPYGIDL